MAFVPTITSLYEDISKALRNKLNLSDDDLKKVLDAVAIVLAGQLKLAYLSLADIQENVFPDTADTTENGGTLDRHGLIQLNRIKKPATDGVFNVDVSGVVGSVLRSGLTFKSNDDSLNPGKLYVLDVETTLATNPQIAEIRSLDGGIDFSLDVGNELTITEPVIGVDKVVLISLIVSAPLAAESEDSYRRAIVDSIQLEPQGGAKTDYRLWASDAQGVKDTYPYVKTGDSGTVQVYVEATEADSSDGNGTPTAPILVEVADVIEFDPDITKPLFERGRRPIQSNLEVLPILTNPVDVEITGLNFDTVEIRDSIESNIKTFLVDVRPFVTGGDLARNKNDILYSAQLQSVVTDVIDSSNFFEELSMFVNGVGQNSFLFSRENIPYLRNLTFI